MSDLQFTNDPDHARGPAASVPTTAAPSQVDLAASSIASSQLNLPGVITVEVINHHSSSNLDINGATSPDIIQIKARSLVSSAVTGATETVAEALSDADIRGSYSVSHSNLDLPQSAHQSQVCLPQSTLDLAGSLHEEQEAPSQRQSQTSIPASAVLAGDGCATPTNPTPDQSQANLTSNRNSNLSVLENLESRAPGSERAGEGENANLSGASGEIQNLEERQLTENIETEANEGHRAPGPGEIGGGLGVEVGVAAKDNTALRREQPGEPEPSSSQLPPAPENQPIEEEQPEANTEVPQNQESVSAIARGSCESLPPPETQESKSIASGEHSAVEPPSCRVIGSLAEALGAEAEAGAGVPIGDYRIETDNVNIKDTPSRGSGLAISEHPEQAQEQNAVSEGAHLQIPEERSQSREQQNPAAESLNRNSISLPDDSEINECKPSDPPAHQSPLTTAPDTPGSGAGDHSEPPDFAAEAREGAHDTSPGEQPQSLAALRCSLNSSADTANTMKPDQGRFSIIWKCPFLECNFC